MPRLILKIVLYIVSILIVLNLFAAIADEFVLKKRNSIEDFLMSQVSLPNFTDKNVAHTIFSDLHNFMRTIQYHPLRGWKYVEFHSATFNTGVDGYRIHGDIPDKHEGEIWLFGGSTLMGWGATDNETISGWLQRMMPKYVIRNFSQMGYTSSQELIQCMEILTRQPNAKPIAVIFFDGKNEFWAGCSGLQSHNTVWSHEMHTLYEEGKMRAVGNSFYPLVSFLIEPLRKTFLRARYGLYLNPRAKSSLCTDVEGHADLVFKTMLQNWSVAKILTEGRGGRFLGVLHPNTALSKSRTDHLQPEIFLNKPYLDAYRNAAVNLRQMQILWAIDLTSAYDNVGDDYIFLDDTHLTARGGEIMATVLKERINAMIGNRQVP